MPRPAPRVAPATTATRPRSASRSGDHSMALDRTARLELPDSNRPRAVSVAVERLLAGDVLKHLCAQAPIYTSTSASSSVGGSGGICVKPAAVSTW